MFISRPHARVETTLTHTHTYTPALFTHNIVGTGGNTHTSLDTDSPNWQYTYRVPSENMYYLSPSRSPNLMIDCSEALAKTCKACPLYSLSFLFVRLSECASLSLSSSPSLSNSLSLSLQNLMIGCCEILGETWQVYPLYSLLCLSVCTDLNTRVLGEPTRAVIVLDANDDGGSMRQMASPTVVEEPTHTSKSITHLIDVVRLTRYFFSPAPCIHIL